MGYLVFYTVLSQLYMIIFMGLFLLAFKFGLAYLKDKNKKQLKCVDKSIYCRDIPCFGNIDLAYWLMFKFSKVKNSDLNNGFIGAYLLSWYKNGYIDIKPSKNFALKNNNYDIYLKDEEWNKSSVENKIYNFLKTVAGNNNILEKNEIKNYCSVDGNKFKLTFLFEDIIKDIEEDLKEKQYISVIPGKNYFLFKTQDEIILSDKLIVEYQNLVGLKKFLLDYSNIEEKMHIEVHIWENYLIFANLMGIADKVKQQFKKTYPKFNVINTIFDDCFDNSIVGNLNSLYRGLKMQFLSLVVVLAMCAFLMALIFIGNR